MSGEKQGTLKSLGGQLLLLCAFVGLALLFRKPYQPSEAERAAKAAWESPTPRPQTPEPMHIPTSDELPEKPRTKKEKMPSLDLKDLSGLSTENPPSGSAQENKPDTENEKR